MPRFDKAYYDRFYRNPDTRAVTPAAARRQAEFIAAYLRYLEVPVKRILDIGCGTGTVLRALGSAFPRARSTGVEFSSYLCERYGWVRDRWSIIGRPVSRSGVCNDVLAYLDDTECAFAIENLAAICAGALFLGVLTLEDLALCDRRRTDAAQIPRPAELVRERLSRYFMSYRGRAVSEAPGRCHGVDPGRIQLKR